MARGTLRIYLGAAPGVGKTFAMLDEGFRRHNRGTDVVVGFVETHGRARTAAQIRDLEVVPRRVVEYRGTMFEELDVDAVLARRPQVALVDELAHTNVPGSRNAKRWQDIDELLAAGIDVISTVNIQHLESLNDVVQQITGIVQRETVPDEAVRQADQIELVDMSPEALRRRMVHGNIYALDKIDAALGNYFRPGNLTALRELALLWVADQVEVSLQAYRERHGIAQPWETRERVAVAVTGAPGADRLIRRAARIANRSKAELVGIHVETSDGLANEPNKRLAEHRQLLADLGGRYREVVAADIGRALVQAARAENATQLLIGATRRSRWNELVRGSVVNKIAQEAGSDLDVHIIASPPAGPAAAEAEAEADGTAGANGSGSARGAPRRAPRIARRRHSQPRLPRRRQLAAALVAVVGLPLLTALLVPLHERLGFTSIALCYLLAVVGIGALGGEPVALIAAVAAFGMLNWFFAEPIHTFTIANERDLIALIAFLVVAGVVSFLVERAARRALEARRARTEAEALATMAGLLLRDDDPFPELLEVLRSTFDLAGASVLFPTATDAWAVYARSGAGPPDSPAEADIVIPIGGDARLALRGVGMGAANRRVIDAFADQLTIAVESRRLRLDAEQAAATARAGEVRDTILAAVSHDLRTPLTTIKTAASSLLHPDIGAHPELRHELARTIDSESDRLNQLVGNLLDLGRLRSTSLTVQRHPTDLGDTVASACRGITTGRPVHFEIADDLPAVDADAVLLERALANLIDNALRYSRDDQPVTVRAVSDNDRVECHVIDHGPGIPRHERQRVFQAFQRTDDDPETAGVGLGLAVARGFIEAMDGTLTIDETPGGGATMIVTLLRHVPPTEP